jgi:membrane-bound serine protease (ClpP class)
MWGEKAMENLIIWLLIALIAFEFIEHVIIPLVGLVIQKKKKSAYGPANLLGRTGEVKKWDKKEGYIFVNGELWRAVSDHPFSPGDQVLVQKVEGLTLRVGSP